MGNTTASENRFRELLAGGKGKFQTEWQLTDTKLLDSVKLTLPPAHAIPIIFVPGIMGSNICDLFNRPVWLLNSVHSIPVGLAWDWARKNAGARQRILHPGRTKVYGAGAVPQSSPMRGLSQKDFLRQGWGEVSQASYHKFLLWLDYKMNGERNPARWEDFTADLISQASAAVGNPVEGLLPGITMKMESVPGMAERGFAVDPIKSDELLKRSKSIFPIYAFGYNWLASNKEASELLKARINHVIAENNVGVIKCSQVILVTHSMGGLVARACAQLADMSRKIVGIVHGVMPATGAAVAYRRCKVGMKDEDAAAGLVIGSDGREVTAVFAQSPGALQLLPSEDYGSKWLEVADPSGTLVASLPIADPYEEIYLQKEKWWGLVRDEWLSPEGGITISWDKFVKNVKFAKEFHRSLSKKYHPRTYVFYGGGTDKGSFEKIRWNMKKGLLPAHGGAVPPAEGVVRLANKDMRTDGSNNLYVGGETVVTTTARGDASFSRITESSFWEIRCARQDSPGDGTVPARSGCDPRKSGGRNVLQQFELSGIQHEPAYRDYPVARHVTYYAVTKLAAMADLS